MPKQPVQLLGASILPFGKSIHAGHPGIVVADYGSMLLVKSTEDKYPGANNNSIGDGRYFQVDSLLMKITKLADV